jgi:hypothetical protein
VTAAGGHGPEACPGEGRGRTIHVFTVHVFTGQVQ